ncbi:hypothetical protein [Desertibacillus haloalkaliphilus]|uniref:hypothetical protein n=1 Tax=Desertibacillus haloalkaliphilus TaxID=1328930 RepID=UPI001C27F5F3|nr:hypothetical protein [Desertibacillus haloalkaliphilus]MBU8906364.1 hypothetical protein [Desertibacillus haloalkaliphilus]
MKRKFFLVLFFFSFIAASLLFFNNEHIAFAHRMVVDVESNHVHVRYDDGTNAPLAVVTGYNEENRLLFEGEVNKNGQYMFDENLDVNYVMADDGLGHRAAWRKTETNSSLSAVPVSIRALLGVSILFFIACFFLYRKSPSTTST